MKKEIQKRHTSLSEALLSNAKRIGPNPNPVAKASYQPPEFRTNRDVELARVIGYDAYRKMVEERDDEEARMQKDKEQAI